MAIVNNKLNTKTTVANNNQNNKAKAQTAAKTTAKTTSVKTVASVVENLRTGETTTAAAMRDLQALGAKVTQKKSGTKQ